MPDWGWKCHNKKPLDQTLVEVEVEELYRCAFEAMRKELVQQDERLEKEREEARRRDAHHLCSRRPGDLLQNRVQTFVTKASTDLGHVTDTQDESEEVEWGKNNASNRKYNTEETGNPGGSQGHNTKVGKE